MEVTDLVLSGELEDYLKVRVGRIIEVCKRRDLKFCVDKIRVLVLGAGGIDM